MDSLKLQMVFFWAAVTVYVLGTCLYLIGLIFQKYKLIKYIPWLALAGLLPHTAGLALRWIQTGHFPYWGKYEVFNAYAWAAIAVYLMVCFFQPRLKIIGLICFPFAFFTMGLALTGSPEVKEIPQSFLTYWLGVHVVFAKLAYGSGIISAFFGGLHLFRNRRTVDAGSSLRWIPSSDTSDYYGYRFAIFAFITLSIMIGSGSVWAYKAWGRYWAWDPVETWSLISWLVYGTVLHLRVTLGWRGRKAAWAHIVAMIVIVFAYFGMPLIYETVHEHLELISYLMSRERLV